MKLVCIIVKGMTTLSRAPAIGIAEGIGQYCYFQQFSGDEEQQKIFLPGAQLHAQEKIGSRYRPRHW
jgi:hypothetical protein